MAKRLSVQEMLAAARKAGAGDGPAPESETAPAPGPAEDAPAAPSPEASAPRAAATPAPTPAELGRPLTLKEKLAAARAGAAPAAAPPAAAAKATAPEVAATGEPGVKAVPPPAPSLGRPMTLQEKMAAARGGAKPAAATGAAPASPSAKAAAPAAKAPAAKRELPPLAEITDPKDLAEALRQTGDKKAKEVAASQVKAAPPGKPAKEKESRPTSVLPKPSRDTAAETAAVPSTRRTWLSVAAILWIGWGFFALGVLQFTAMLGRFMFPNVLAEPPSTIKIGLPTNYEPDSVNERFKAEWGFWIVRSPRYNGTDIIYALQSVCTHLGCPPNWLSGEQKFKCPCHGSGFYISGVNFEGPAPRPLERFKLSVGDDGQIVVDKSRKFQEELGQWSDPDSYITA